MASKVTVVGIGDDGVLSLRPEARRAVAQAELLCGGERHLAFFPDHPAQKLVIKKDLAAVVEQLRAAAQRGQRVVVLASGDPGFYGIGAYLSEQLGREALHIIPNLSSVQLAFARIGVAWHDATVLSVHGRPLAGILRRALHATKLAVLTDAANTPARVAAALLAAGMEDAETYVCARLGSEHEQIVMGRLSAIAQGSFDPLNVMIILREPACVRPLRAAVGLPDDLYEHVRGQITKAEVRAVSLSRLGLQRAHCMWDIGTGCGSVAIEAAAFMPEGAVYAVERDPAQVQLLRRNIHKHCAANVIPVEGEAPEALADLPAPDCVFIGGTGGRLTEVIATVCARLTPGGNLVMNVVTLEHLATAYQLLKDACWPVETVQVNVARGRPVGSLLRFEALNPVTVLSATKPEGAHQHGG